MYHTQNLFCKKTFQLKLLACYAAESLWLYLWATSSLYAKKILLKNRERGWRGVPAFKCKAWGINVVTWLPPSTPFNPVVTVYYKCSFPFSPCPAFLCMFLKHMLQVISPVVWPLQVPSSTDKYLAIASYQIWPFVFLGLVQFSEHKGLGTLAVFS